jgi:ADP-ribose pyrophosphatase
VKTSTGATTTREVVRHGGAVAMVPLLDDGRVVLVRQFRHPVREALLEIPAGTLGAGEAPEACAQRELMEEVHYRAASLERLFSLCLAPGYSTELIHIYLATGLEPAQLAHDEDEVLRIEVLEMGEAVALIDDGGIKDAKTVAGVLAAARRLGIDTRR